MSYDVQIVADSIGPNKARLTTFALRYPRMIHSELMTHRAFSRNASSTRAIPTAKMLEWVEKDPAMPVYWGKNQRGMQATEELELRDINHAKATWLEARDKTVQYAKYLMDVGVHKQIASRILEPWAHINVVVSATNFENWFSLRVHKAAMPEIQVLAVKMARLYRDSVPREVRTDCWHLPFATDAEMAQLEILEAANEQDQAKDPWDDSATIKSLVDFENKLVAACTARCARVSYKTFDGKSPNLADDIALHDRLRDSGHWSPFEHCCQAQQPDFWYRSGNFVGWDQYRKQFVNENRTEFDYRILKDFPNDFVV